MEAAPELRRLRHDQDWSNKVSLLVHCLVVMPLTFGITEGEGLQAYA